MFADVDIGVTHGLCEFSTPRISCLFAAPPEIKHNNNSSRWKDQAFLTPLDHLFTGFLPWPEAPSQRRTHPASGRSQDPETEASSPAVSAGPTSAPPASWSWCPPDAGWTYDWPWTTMTQTRVFNIVANYLHKKFQINWKLVRCRSIPQVWLAPGTPRWTHIHYLLLRRGLVLKKNIRIE